MTQEGIIWEYKVDIIDHGNPYIGENIFGNSRFANKIQERINFVSERGWELDKIEYTQHNLGYPIEICIYKRKVTQ